MNTKVTSNEEKVKTVDKAADTSDAKPDKYLTEMKELPPSFASEEKKEIKENRQDKTKFADEEVSDANHSLKENGKSNNDIPEEKSEVSDLDDSEESGRKLPFTYKDIILGVVNLVSIIFFVIILINFSDKSQELRELRIQEIKNNSTFNLETSEIDAAIPKAEALSKLFLNESGVVDFVNDLELQKTEGGAISKVTFASQKAVADRTGNYGVPIVIELVGSWQAIDTDLQKIDKLPYLFRPAEVEVGYDEDDPQVVIYKYGIFLYVEESLGKTR